MCTWLYLERRAHLYYHSKSLFNQHSHVLWHRSYDSFSDRFFYSSVNEYWCKHVFESVRTVINDEPHVHLLTDNVRTCHANGKKELRRDGFEICYSKWKLIKPLIFSIRSFSCEETRKLGDKVILTHNFWWQIFNTQNQTSRCNSCFPKLLSPNQFYYIFCFLVNPITVGSNDFSIPCRPKAVLGNSKVPKSRLVALLSDIIINSVIEIEVLSKMINKLYMHWTRSNQECLMRSLSIEWWFYH